jgi:IS30 family transposase
VGRRKRLGDVEVDLIIGKNHQGGLLVMLDRASLITTIDKISSKKPKHIKKLILKRMKNNKHLKTMTFDNDQAFGLHQEIANELNIKTFFTRPYTSQDKGSVENRNGVIRRFYPKKTGFNEVSAKDVKKVETMINNRPVRKFDYKTPNEVHLLKANVALIAWTQHLKKEYNFAKGTTLTKLDLAALVSDKYIIKVFDGTNWEEHKIIVSH